MGNFEFTITVTAVPFVAPKAVAQDIANQQKAAENAARMAALQAQLAAAHGTPSPTPIPQPTAEPALIRIPTNVPMPLMDSGGGGALKWKRAAITIPDVSFILTPLDKAVSTLDGLVKTLSPIFDLIEMYIGMFSSFAKLLSSMFDMMEEAVQDIGKDIGSAGVYVNVIVPPAFLKESISDVNLQRLSNGGFHGFLTRLQMSLYDDEDKQRPTFGPTSICGGVVFAVDSNSLDQFFTGLNQITALLDFVKLFGINLKPPPPRSIRGFPGYFQDKTGKKRFGIQLEWDRSTLGSMNFLVSRSRFPQGERKLVEYVPTTLGGKDGLISVVQTALAGDGTWPSKVVTVYSDPTFNNGKPVSVTQNKLDGGAIFIDYDMGGSYDSAGIFTPDSKTPGNVYYVVQSTIGEVNVGADEAFNGSNPLIGSPSAPIKVTFKTCDDSAKKSGVILHEGGVFEFLAPGRIRIGSWTSISVKGMIPFVPELVNMLARFVGMLKGMTSDASDGFSSLVKQIQAKFTLYANILHLLSRLLKEIQKFVVGPSVAMLVVPPEAGGVDKFLDNVRSAKVPDGQPKFSGPTGITAGIVAMYGVGGNEELLSPQSQAALQAHYTAIDAAFSIIKKVLGG